MTDRVVEHPNRYQLVPVAGTTDTYDLVPVPGTVTAAGTDLNKATLLSDTTVAAIEAAVETALSSDTPDKALAAIASVVGANAKMPETGSYVGTGTYREENANSFTFSVAPKLIFISATGETLGYFDVGKLTTTYEAYGYMINGIGFVFLNGGYAKKSSDGKTIYWYGPDVPRQLNSAGITYRLTAIN